MPVLLQALAPTLWSSTYFSITFPISNIRLTHFETFLERKACSAATLAHNLCACIPIIETGYAKRGLICVIINIEKSHFEIVIIVYFENAWCLVYEILHQSIVIQGNSAGALFNGLLAELPAFLDSFFTNTISEYIGGCWSAGDREPRSGGENTCCVVILVL